MFFGRYRSEFLIPQRSVYSVVINSIPFDICNMDRKSEH